MTTVDLAREPWAYPQIEANYRTNPDAWVEVSPEFADQALNVLPPIYTQGGFMVSEAYTHELGKPVYAGFVMIGERHFAICSTVRWFGHRIAGLRRYLASEGSEEQPMRGDPAPSGGYMHESGRYIP